VLIMSGPMALRTATKLEDFRDLALLIWRESRGESFDGQLAVAHSVMNRVARPSWWGTDLRSIIWKKWQYSSLTDPNDPQLHLQPKLPDPSWLSALGAAHDVLYGGADNPIPGADSYYDISMDKIGKPPNWIPSARFVKQIGRLKFYDVDHDHEAAALVAAGRDFDQELREFLSGSVGTGPNT
jgi:spore germination cell wall hydrolase CwlJ-like protein